MIHVGGSHKTTSPGYLEIYVHGMNLQNHRFGSSISAEMLTCIMELVRIPPVPCGKSDRYTMFLSWTLSSSCHPLGRSCLVQLVYVRLDTSGQGVRHSRFCAKPR